MKKNRLGFTLIEVALFLAITTALFVGIAATTQSSLFQQRFSDSVQNFAEFMRSIYSQVANVQSEKTGRSDMAIYGKVITMRQDDSGENEIKTYNLIGKAEERTLVGYNNADDGTGVTCTGSSVLNRLACLGANVVVSETKDDGSTEYRTVGFVEDYVPHWAAQIQTVDGWNDGYSLYEGIIVVTHSPNSGNVYTYVMQGEENKDQIEAIIADIEQCDGGATCPSGNPFMRDQGGGNFQHIFNSTAFKAEDIDFCVNPYNSDFAFLRRNIRIEEGTHNASGVEVMSDDRDEDGLYNRCQ